MRFDFMSACRRTVVSVRPYQKNYPARTPGRCKIARPRR